MTAPLDYASSRASRVRRFAQEAAFIACVAAIGILGNSTLLARELTGYHRCGTGLHEMGTQLFLLMPAACTIPGGCWWYAKGAATCAFLCRLSFLGASAGWLTCTIFVATR